MSWKQKSVYCVDPSDMSVGPGVPSRQRTTVGADGRAATGCCVTVVVTGVAVGEDEVTVTV